jgi:hypothetical protein
MTTAQPPHLSPKKVYSHYKINSVALRCALNPNMLFKTKPKQQRAPLYIARVYITSPDAEFRPTAQLQASTRCRLGEKPARRNSTQNTDQLFTRSAIGAKGRPVQVHYPTKLSNHLQQINQEKINNYTKPKNTKFFHLTYSLQLYTSTFVGSLYLVYIRASILTSSR